MNEIQRIGFDWITSSERVPYKGVMEKIAEAFDYVIGLFADAA